MSHYATSDETRRALIEAAGELVARNGIPGTSTRQIASRAGQNLGSIHYHFGSKEGLLLAVARHAGRRLQADPLGRYLDGHISSDRCEATLVVLVKGFVSLHCDLVFSSERTDWGPAFCFQAIQHPGALRDDVLLNVLDLTVRAHVRLYRTVCPSAPASRAWPWAYSMMSQATFFAVFEPALLPYMGWTEYPDTFVADTRSQLIDNALHSLGLPGSEKG